ncbi:MAG: hypothetical protein ACPGJV_05335 [Bacteriovoracaceae bacterium]
MGILKLKFEVRSSVSVLVDTFVQTSQKTYQGQRPRGFSREGNMRGLN